LAVVRFTEGAVVQRGDVLFEIDPRLFQAEVEARAADELSRLDAERTQLWAEDDVVQGDAGVFTRVVGVYKALGGAQAPAPRARSPRAGRLRV
jgi:multidrug efflux pump subunit AcrA (membrane-fusion protein)